MMRLRRAHHHEPVSRTLAWRPPVGVTQGFWLCRCRCGHVWREPVTVVREQDQIESVGVLRRWT